MIQKNSCVTNSTSRGIIYKNYFIIELEYKTWSSTNFRHYEEVNIDVIKVTS